MSAGVLNASQVASLCGVNPQTVRRWARKGYLPSAGTSPSGRAHFAAATVEKFLRKHGYQVPPALGSEVAAEPRTAQEDDRAASTNGRQVLLDADAEGGLVVLPRPAVA